MQREMRLLIPKGVYENLKTLAGWHGTSPSQYCEKLTTEAVEKVVVNAIGAETAAKASLVCR